MEFDESRKFGVEIEYTCDRDIRSEVKQRMENEFGIRSTVNGYHGGSRSSWSHETDSSCGWETVSPPLQGEEGLEEIRNVITCIYEAGGRVDSNCGLHVHHDCNDLDLRELQYMASAYVRYEQAFDELVPNSRRRNNNGYCSGYSTRPNRYLHRIKRVESVSRLDSVMNRGKINFGCYRRQGTVEFRHHSGTLNYQKIRNWVILTQRMVMKAKQLNRISLPDEDRESVRWADLAWFLKLNDGQGATDRISECRQWWNERRAELAA